MTRGGARKGSGRKVTLGETKSVFLDVVRVRPSQLAKYKRVAWYHGMSLSRWIEQTLDAQVSREKGFVAEALTGFDQRIEEASLEIQRAKELGQPVAKLERKLARIMKTRNDV